MKHVLVVPKVFPCNSQDNKKYTHVLTCMLYLTYTVVEVKIHDLKVSAVRIYYRSMRPFLWSAMIMVT